MERADFFLRLTDKGKNRSCATLAYKGAGSTKVKGSAQGCERSWHCQQPRRKEVEVLSKEIRLHPAEEFPFYIACWLSPLQPFCKHCWMVI